MSPGTTVRHRRVYDANRSSCVPSERDVQNRLNAPEQRFQYCAWMPKNAEI
jgi:hypothetical protein